MSFYYLLSTMPDTLHISHHGAHKEYDINLVFLFLMVLSSRVIWKNTILLSNINLIYTK